MHAGHPTFCRTCVGSQALVATGDVTEGDRVACHEARRQLIVGPAQGAGAGEG